MAYYLELIDNKLSMSQIFKPVLIAGNPFFELVKRTSME